MPKSKRVNLTVPRVSGLKAPKSGQRFAWDLEVPGLAVRVTSRGAKSFIFERSFNGKTLRTTIGATTAWRLPDAREEARRLQRLIDRGIDPRAERRAQKAAEKLLGLLVADVWEAYLEAHESQWGARHMADNRYHARAPDGDKPGGVLWPLLQKHLGDIDAAVLIQWAQDALEATSESKANQGKGSALRQSNTRLRAFWRWACQREEYSGAMADSSMFSHSDLKKLIPSVHAKNDVLEKGQLKTWFKHVRQIENPVISAYLQTLLLTGARRNELAALKWSDVDFRWNKVLLHDKIEEGGRAIPLTPYCKFLFSALPRKDESEFVFSSLTSESGHLEEPRIAHKRALAAAGLPSDLSIHGLRRSFASLSEWVEMPVGIVAQIMGHKPSATAERHYKIRPIDLLAKWHGKLETWILKQAGIAFDPAKVKEGLRVV